MRIVIKSSDRVGISQEILSIFSKQAWNLKAVEIKSCFTYVHVEYDDLTLQEISLSLSVVNGVTSVEVINLLPSEQRESHLQALLDKMPEPIIDVDSKGIILAMNQACLTLIPQDSSIDKNENSKQATDEKGEQHLGKRHLGKKYFGKSIGKFLTQLNINMLNDTAVSQAITVQGKAYLLDISPVFSATNANVAISPMSPSQSKHVSGYVLLLRSMNTLGRQISLLQSHQTHSFDTIIGQSSKINLIKAQSKRFAELDLPVLISGETGTGKELIARSLHQESYRANAPFLAINCSALPEHLLESELFGYANGAFTGAQKGGKPGLIELAEGGCLFLDEIAEMSSYLQAKLLRFLQDLTYRRVGGSKEITANIRILSASHQDLAKLIENKSFREDLYYRLNVLNIELPPLRDRVSDISLLAEFFIENAAKQVNGTQEGLSKPPKINAAGLTLLENYGWPGNIRQLQNVLFSAVALSNGDDIEIDSLQQILSKFSISNQQQSIIDESKIKDWSSAQAAFEANLLGTLYPEFPTTRKLAQRLNVSHNKVAMKLREHNIG